MTRIKQDSDADHSRLLNRLAFFGRARP